jgi:hypothetical protein
MFLSPDPSLGLIDAYVSTRTYSVNAGLANNAQYSGLGRHTGYLVGQVGILIRPGLSKFAKRWAKLKTYQAE